MLPAELAERYRREGHWLSDTLPERFAGTCAEQGGRGTAISEGDVRLRFGEVESRVERLAGHLWALGVRPGDVVSWQLPNWWEATIVHWAALRVGATPNPLNPIFRGRELRFVLSEARPRVLVVPETYRRFAHAALATTLASEIEGLEHVVVVRGSSPGAIELSALLEEPASMVAPPPPGNASAPALLMYTSGTTGDPKGVQHSHETILYEILSLVPVHGLTTEDCYLGGSPVAHIAGLVYGVLMPFSIGTRTAFLERWNASNAVELIERERVTFMTGAPTFLQGLAEHADSGADLSSFRLYSTGATNIPTEAVTEAGAKLSCMVKRAYGSTEVPTLTATRAEDPAQLRAGTDGRVIEPAEMRIVTSDGAEAGVEAEGEIWARSPEVFIGYRNPALNSDCFDDQGWYRTGDLGVVNRDGYLIVTGRLKDIIIRGGENISVKEIEDLLASHPSVADVAVVGMPDPLLGERACAFVATRRGTTFSFDEMVAFLESKEIARQKIPERLEVRSRLPKTASGKVRKAALRGRIRPAPK